eukprot:m.20713 g.20713  ORF g.20713 m.20713 type:complete len:85 (-) comp10271_c0_seq2:88-342(-)
MQQRHLTTNTSTDTSARARTHIHTHNHTESTTQRTRAHTLFSLSWRRGYEMVVSSTGMEFNFKTKIPVWANTHKTLISFGSNQT